MMKLFFGRSWLVVIPTVAILVLALSLTSTTNAAPAGGPGGLAAPDDQSTVCASCHAEQDADWKASTHAGVGATCQSCHGEYKEGHPAGETMTLPMESETCQTCHEGAFAQWEVSAHPVVGVDCFDCHTAHTQGLRIEPEEKLCAACHTPEETQLAHGIHGISGVQCASCHMAPLLTMNAQGKAEQLSNHTFAVASDVCARCHTDEIHGAASGAEVKATSILEAATVAGELTDRRVAELEAEVTDYEEQAKRSQNLAVVGMGLALGVGGMGGLVVGLAAATLLARRKQS